MTELVGGITNLDVIAAIDGLLLVENWDDITVKVVLRRLEQQLLPDHPEGVLKPHKKFVKEVLDPGMSFCFKALPIDTHVA